MNAHHRSDRIDIDSDGSRMPGGIALQRIAEPALTVSERCQALLIEADDPYRAAIASSLRLAGCRVEQVTTPDLAFPALQHRPYDIVVWGVSTSDASRRSEVISEVR